MRGLFTGTRAYAGSFMRQRPPPRLRNVRREPNGSSLIEIAVALVLLAVILVPLLGGVALLVRGSSKTNQDTEALNLARSQIESIKNLPFSEATPYPTIVPPEGYAVTLNQTPITSGILQQIDVTANHDLNSLALSALNAKQVPPILASTQATEIGWQTLVSTPGDVGVGGALVAAGNYIYAFAGNSTTFWRYDVFANTWAVMATAPSATGAGACLVHDSNVATSNYIFAARGRNTNHFWRYDIDADAWTTMASPPSSINHGGACAWDGSNYIYAFRGDGTASFWRYSISGNSWTALASAPVKPGSGGGEGGLLTYAGGALYAFRTSNTTDFWRYNISANTWTTTLAQAPAAVGPGGSLTTDGQDLFALRGNSTSAYWAYRIASDTWDVLGTAPGTAAVGGSPIQHNGIVYALGGGSTTAFWKIHT